MDQNDIVIQVQYHPDRITCTAIGTTKGWAGSIECRCSLKTCTLVKSGYIFDTYPEAIKWAKAMLKEMKSLDIQDE